ncbi:MAG: hypothetical protein GY772_22395, partial [bacterium]|nr:hypothetical protein [bacterium]
MKYLLLLCCLLLSCGKDVAGGGGADVGNPSIAGVVLSGDFNAASGVSLSLQPSDYIGDSSAVQRAVSAPDGSYSFAVEAGQRYTLWGRDSATGAVLFRRALSLADTATTLYDQLEAPCTLTVSLPAGAPLHAGAVALPGVPRAFAAVVDSQARTVRVAGLPRGEIAPLFRQEGAGFVPFTDSLIIGGTTQSAVAYELWEPLLAGGVPLRGDTVRALLGSATGARWIGTQRGLLNRAGEHYSSAAVLSLAEDSAGVLWCGTAAGVARLTESGLVAAVE